MNREQFIKSLCKIVSEFSEQVSKDPGTCFCGENAIANMEHDHGTWRRGPATLFAIANKLGVEFKLEETE